MKTIDFYIDIIDNYGDLGFAINLALKSIKSYPDIKIRIFSNDEKLFNKMIGNNIKCKMQNAKVEKFYSLCHSELDSESSSEGQFITFNDINNLENFIPSKTIFTFFDYKLQKDYLYKGEKGKSIVQFGYFLLHKGVENLHGTSYMIDGNKYTHFIPSLRKNTGGIIQNKEIEIENGELCKEEFINYINKKYNTFIPENSINKKCISVFVYKDTLNEIIDVISKGKNDIVFFVFDSNFSFIIPAKTGNHCINEQLNTNKGSYILKSNYSKDFSICSDKLIDSLSSQEGQFNNIYFMPFLELEDYNYFLSICDANIVRGENSLCTSLSYGKPTLWDIYKEDNDAHNEKIDDFLEFLSENIIQKKLLKKCIKDPEINSGGQYEIILKFFNSLQKKEGFIAFLDSLDNYEKLFKLLGIYIENECDLVNKLKKICNI